MQPNTIKTINTEATDKMNDNQPMDSSLAGLTGALNDGDEVFRLKTMMAYGIQKIISERTNERQIDNIQEIISANLAFEKENGQLPKLVQLLVAKMQPSPRVLISREGDTQLRKEASLVFTAPIEKLLCQVDGLSVPHKAIKVKSPESTQSQIEIRKDAASLPWIAYDNISASGNVSSLSAPHRGHQRFSFPDYIALEDEKSRTEIISGLAKELYQVLLAESFGTEQIVSTISRCKFEFGNPPGKNTCVDFYWPEELPDIRGRDFRVNEMDIKWECCGQRCPEYFKKVTFVGTLRLSPQEIVKILDQTLFPNGLVVDLWQESLITQLAEKGPIMSMPLQNFTATIVLFDGGRAIESSRYLAKDSKRIIKLTSNPSMVIPQLPHTVSFGETTAQLHYTPCSSSHTSSHQDRETDWSEDDDDDQCEYCRGVDCFGECIFGGDERWHPGYDDLVGTWMT